MSLNPFEGVTTYGEMLKKLGWLAFISWGVGVWYLAQRFPLLLDWPVLATTVEFASLKVPIGIALPALLLALVFHLLKMHDRLSDVFGIRATFDLARILTPLASRSGVPLSTVETETVRAQRDRLMQSVFYTYASSTEPLISRHAISQALSTWTWYWAALEAQAVGFLVAVACAVAGDFRGALPPLAGLALLELIKRLLSIEINANAATQVDLIAGDPGRLATIAKAFRDAL